MGTVDGLPMVKNGQASGITVCVGIPTYNRERVLVETIEQVLAQDPPADEVLVVDQTETHGPETEAYLARADEAARIRWIKHWPPNLNGARNRAIAETKCDVLILIDDDVKLVPSFIEKHVRNFDDLEVVAVCGRVLQGRAGNVPPDRAQPWLRQFDCNPCCGWGTERVERVAAFWGGNHALRVSVVRDFGGFDENFFGPLYNESDLALRLWRAGKLIVFDPEAELLHFGFPTGGFRKANKTIPEYWRSFSTWYFHMKHFFPRWYFWQQVFCVQFRRRVLRKDNVFRPWRLPWAVASYAYSFLLAAWYCIRGQKGLSIELSQNAPVGMDHSTELTHQ